MTLPQPLTDKTESRPRLDAVKDILTALETATPAGQQYLMGKVLGLLRHQAPTRDHWIDDRQWSQIAGAFDALAYEANRLAPDADAFSRHATTLAEHLSRGPSRPTM
jgi:hypothetical protein